MPRIAAKRPKMLGERKPAGNGPKVEEIAPKWDPGTAQNVVKRPKKTSENSTCSKKAPPPPPAQRRLATPPPAMARPPASAPAPPPPAPWPDSQHAPRRGGPSQPAPPPGTPPQSPPGTPPPSSLPPDSWLLPDAWVPLRDTPVCPPPPPPGGGGGSRRVLFADALGLPLTRLRQYRPWDPRGRGGGGSGGVGSGGDFGGSPQSGEGGAGGEQPPPGSWMRPGKGRPQEAEDAQPPPPDCCTEPDPSPTPPLDAEQPPPQEEEAVARELEQLYLSHLRRLRGGGGGSNNGAPPPRNGGPPFPDRAPNTSLANEMALRYEEGGAGGRCSPPVLLGRGGPVEGALVVPARPPRGRGGGLGGALRGCGVVLALAVLVPVAWGGGRGGPHGRLGAGALPGAGLADMSPPPKKN
ncbi:uncharacterized protein [Patagioenas fasciata]|uniref:uncharacterized protein n=1 Tax=Patagioenas fasciata TaxID=372321 RepID=UPI003A990A23